TSRRSSSPLDLMDRFASIFRSSAPETLRILPRVGTIQAGFYDEYQMPDGSRRRVASTALKLS
ncbi:hypothetical protein ACI3S9_30775, partial [Klebsiella pneumoniae]